MENKPNIPTEPAQPQGASGAPQPQNQMPQQNYQQNPNQQHYQPQQPIKAKKPVYKKWWFWLIIVIAVLIIIGIIGSGGSDESTSQTETNPQSQAQQTPADDTEDTEIPDLIEAGTTVTVDGLEISYISCDADFTEYNEYSAPSEGNKVVRAEFEFKNNSDSDCSLFSLDCYADGTKCEIYFYADDYASPTLETISPGRTFKSVVYFEVPKDAQNIEMEMETNFWTEEKIIFNIK